MIYFEYLLYFMGWVSREGGNTKKLVYLKSRWGEYKNHCVQFLNKNYTLTATDPKQQIWEISAGLESGDLEGSRATDFGSGWPHTWGSRVWGSRVWESRGSGNAFRIWTSTCLSLRNNIEDPITQALFRELDKCSTEQQSLWNRSNHELQTIEDHHFKLLDDIWLMSPLTAP